MAALPAFSRRAFLRLALGAGAAHGLHMSASQTPPSRPASRPHVAVVGAGAFGGWSAWHLLQRGARVTLLDAWGPGNSRASSGGETRVIRAAYDRDIYSRMVARALDLWREADQRWQRRLFHPIGVLWMAGEDDAYERAALQNMRAAGLRAERLSAEDAARRWPQIDLSGVHWAMFEPDGGYLMARQACMAVVEAFIAAGGDYRQLGVTPGDARGGHLRGLRLSDSSTFTADAYVFACGPWLGALFPDVVGERVLPTRQEVFFFGTPAGDARFHHPSLPVWIDNGASVFYGIPGSEHRGFKLADDAHGPRFDPTSGDRTPSASALAAARAYLARRFPALRDAPLLEARVCQYENSPDGNLIVDRHPEARNLLLVGGGSGHGFKLGPALGEMVAALALGDAQPDPFFGLARLAARDATSRTDSRGRHYSA